MLTDRSGGVSAAPFDSFNLARHVGDDEHAVDRNRQQLTDAVGRPVAWMQQVHGDAVARVVDPSAAAPVADALVTTNPGVAVAVLVADCVPLLLADADAGVVAAVHVGRRGLAAGVARAGWSALADLGAQSGSTHAHIGPAICGGCYEVPTDMQRAVAEQVPAAAVTTTRGTPGLDIRAGLLAQLAKLGITAVTSDGRCTAESGELYSHRRDGTTGRFAGLVWLDGTVAP
ncbi:MAG: peptidoglycan editing factor PgeF [Frankiales bacterium]|nr:peptidoglycan editing factor PgeF [Frankiales bacterium]